MNIGTAKPSIHQQSIVKHWGIDIVMPTENFSICDYINYSKDKIAEIQARGKNVLIAGGSGFYMKSFLDPVIDNVYIPKNVTDDVENIYAKTGHVGLLTKLKSLNKSGFYKNFDEKNTIKVKKALARCMATGLSMCELKDKYEAMKSSFYFIEKYSMLMVKPIEILKQRVFARTINMVKNGLIEEVDYLLAKNYMQKDSKAAKSVGYKETIDFIESQSTDYDKLVNSIYNNTTSLIKKQLTWFKYQIKFNKLIYT